MIKIEGYSTKEIQARANVTRDAVSKWARKYKWTVSKIGNANIYDRQDVDKFLAARLRRKLMQAAGWIDTNTLIQADDRDAQCPRCGGFAVGKPDKVEAKEWVEVYCENCGLMPQEGKE